MHFDSLFWLSSPWHKLLERAQQERFPHALMLTGFHGVGKAEFAEHLARWLLCLNPDKQAQAKPCGKCHSCQLFNAGNHPDYLQVEPEGKSKQILIGQIREVNQRLTETPSISDNQVLVINPIDVMNLNASNAFLKTLEEPPGQARIILISDYYGSVMPTIKSRCQRLNLAAPDMDSTQNWLAQQGFTNPQDNQLAISQHKGAPLAALNFLSHSGIEEYKLWEKSLIDWINHKSHLSDVVENWNKLELSELLDLLYSVLLRWGKAALGVTFNAELSQPLNELFKHSSLNQQVFNDLQARCLQLQVLVHSGNTHYNKTLLLESMLLNLQRMAKPHRQ